MGEWRRVSSWKNSRGHNRPPKHWPPPPPPPPPSHPGSSNVEIPWWERKFLASVCPIPLEELSFMRSSMSIYKNVLDWDDSAALEAFQKAKARFWAKFNGRRSDISLPDPDMYIDKVNYDAIIDPELIEDLYKEPPAPADQDATGNDGLDNSVFTDEQIPATGWDDAEDPASSGVFAALPRSNNWDVHIERPTRQSGANDADNTCSGWDVNPVKSEDNGNLVNEWPCNDGWTNESPWNEEWGNKQDSLWDNHVDKSWGPCQSNNESGGRYSRKRYRGGRFGSRFQMDDYQRNNNNWRNCRGRNNRNYSNEHELYTWQSRRTA